MASEGPNSPGTAADDDAVGTVAWSDPDNIKISDNNRAIASQDAGAGNGQTHYIKATNFGFSIPLGATINGIIVQAEGYRQFISGTGSETSTWRIVKGGSISATTRSKALKYGSPDGTVSVGTSVDLWGEVWGSADINNANFGVVFTDTVTGSLVYTQNIDHIEITVYYTEAAVGTNMQINIGDVLKDVSELKINIGGVLKDVVQVKQNIGGVLKDVFG